MHSMVNSECRPLNESLPAYVTQMGLVAAVYTLYQSR
jgi:hypothetical protein